MLQDVWGLLNLGPKLVHCQSVILRYMQMFDLVVFEKLLVATEEVLELKEKINVIELLNQAICFRLYTLTKYVVTVSG